MATPAPELARGRSRRGWVRPAAYSAGMPTGIDRALAALTLTAVTVPAGTRIWHGSDCTGPLDPPAGPAWFTRDPAAAADWAGWSEGLPDGRERGQRRLLGYELTAPVRLLDTTRLEDWSALGVALLDDPEPGPWALADALTRAEGGGWSSPRELLLCDTGVLRKRSDTPLAGVSPKRGG